MGRYITESGMKFGKFKEENLFYIEESNVYKTIGTSVKTVEFIAIKDDDIILLEAKTGCPQPCKDEQEDKRLNFELEISSDKKVNYCYLDINLLTYYALDTSGNG